MFGSVQRRWLWVLLALVVLDSAVLYWRYRNERERRYDPLIRHAAQRYGVDPALVKAVMWRESAFNPEARGTVGEVGLMQIRPLTAGEWAQAEGSWSDSVRHPKNNVLAGAWYLAKLLRRYRQTDFPLAYALADYNAGRSNVLRWMQGVAKTNSAAFLEQMSFPGTRAYIESVQARYRHYAPAFAGSSKEQSRLALP